MEKREMSDEMSEMHNPHNASCNHVTLGHYQVQSEFQALFSLQDCIDWKKFSKMKLIKYTHGIRFLMVKNIHKIPLATVTFVVAISLSRPSRLYLALDNPAMKINTRPTSNFGTCRILPCILAFLRAFLCNNYCVEKNVFN